MGTKIAILLLGLLAFLLVISSEVAARDLAQASPNAKEAEAVENTNEVEDAKYPGGGNDGGYPGNGGGYPGRGGGGYPGRGGGGYPGRGGGGYPGRGGGGYPGGGGGGYPGRGGYGGGHCRHGCCYGAYAGGCGRCCSYAGEAVVTQTENKTHN